MGQKRKRKKPKKDKLNFILNGTCSAKAASVSVYSHQKVVEVAVFWYAEF